MAILPGGGGGTGVGGGSYLPLAGGTMTGALLASVEGTLIGASAANRFSIVAYGLSSSGGVTPGEFTWNTGTSKMRVSSGLMQLGSAFSVQWSAGDPGSVACDVGLYRDAANTLALRNSTNAQTFNLYETYTDASNYSRLSISAPAGGPIAFVSQAAGTGTARSIIIGSATVLEVNRGGAGRVESQQFTHHASVGNAFSLTSGGLALSSTSLVALSSDATWYGTKDSGIGRNAAGVVEVNSGTLGTLRDLTMRNIIGQVGYHELTEMTAPSAPATNSVRLYAEDNGSGKTRLMARFPTGAAQQLSIEP